MAISYDKRTGRFRDESGRFISKVRGLKSSIARSQYQDAKKSRKPKRKTPKIPKITQPKRKIPKIILGQIDEYKSRQVGYKRESVTIGEELDHIYATHPFSKGGFFYAREQETRKKSNYIVMYAIMHDLDYGYSLQAVTFKRAARQTVNEWENFRKRKARAIFQKIADAQSDTQNARMDDAKSNKPRIYQTVKQIVGWRFATREEIKKRNTSR